VSLLNSLSLTGFVSFETILNINQKMSSNYVRLQVLTAASLKFTVFCDVAPYSHVEVDRRFRGAYCVHHQGYDVGSTHL
jgi:hypothetical protein